MESYWVMNDAGKARHEEFVRDANRARRFLRAKKSRRLSALLQSVLLIFI
jgi:hypothetical protein